MRILWIAPILIALWTQSASAISESCPKYTSTGFCWPTGKSEFGFGGEHLEHGVDRGGGYLRGKYHLGLDVMEAQGGKVWPLSEGSVLHYSYNGWGAGNYAILLLHELDNGTNFVALYGHLKIEAELPAGSRVTPAESIGETVCWSEHTQ